MPWTKRNFPDSMKNLPKAVREKAVDIANALLDETNMGEGRVIAIAISRAKDWAVNHGKSIKNKNVDSRTTDVKKHGQDRYVIPRDDGWAIKVEGSKKAEKIFKDKTGAVKQARKEAKKSNASLTIQRKTGKVQKRISYNPTKKAARQKAH
jgi:uncharacterized protein YdaT